MYILYNSLLMLLTVALLPLLPLVLCLRRKYRIGFLQKCGLVPRHTLRQCRSHPPVWVHAVSVGEVMAAIPLLKALKAALPGTPVLLSTVTATGHQTAQRNAGMADHIIYFPFDYPVIVRQVVRGVMPRAFIMLETEIWPNVLRELHRHRIPVMIVSGRISERSHRSYLLFRFFFRRVLGCIDCFCMQTEQDARRIEEIGAAAARISVTGNIKFDQQLPAITPREQQQLSEALHIDPNLPVLIAGSTHRGEETILLDAFETMAERHPDLLLILAPRHPERFDEVDELLHHRGIDFIRKTRLRPGAPPPPGNVILLDTIGELAKTYSIGTIIFIGGSLVPGVGGHNVLEPAAFQKPVIFGRHMENFTEIARILIERGAALQVSDAHTLTEKALGLLDHPEQRQEIGQRAYDAIRENSGAVTRCMQVFRDLLPDHGPDPCRGGCDETALSG